MFPVTEQYFKNVYIDKNTKKPIELSNKLKRNLKSKANKLLSFYYRKEIKLMFTDVEGILQKLNIKREIYFILVIVLFWCLFGV